MAFDFKESEIPGLYIVLPHYFEDTRGNITKTFHKETFEQMGLKCDLGESMITVNQEKDVIRGFHFQKPPYTQSKIYYCLSGSFYNYSLDLRKGSPTYGKVVKFHMSASDRKMLYIPDGIANAHRILEPNTTVYYNLTSKFMPEYDSGVRWDSLGIDFEIENPVMSEKDSKLPRFDELDSPFIYGVNC